MMYHASKTATSAGNVTTTKGVLRALTIIPGASAGSLEVRDGSGASDPVLITLPTKAGGEPVHLQLGDGLVFNSGVNIKTLSNITSVTFWF